MHQYAPPYVARLQHKIAAENADRKSHHGHKGALAEADGRNRKMVDYIVPDRKVFFL